MRDYKHLILKNGEWVIRVRLTIVVFILGVIVGYIWAYNALN